VDGIDKVVNIYISQILLKNKIIKVLILTSNNIGDLGTQYISKSLEKNCTLKILNL
jgi:hypothetical protein